MIGQSLSLVGALMVLAAYVANQRGWLDRRSAWYSILNAVGAGLLAGVAAVERQWGFLLLEGTWSLVSFWALLSPAAAAPES